MVEDVIEATETKSADLGQVVQKVAAEKQPVEVNIVQTKMLQEAPYIDPISEEYKLKKENQTGTIKNRESKEGIKSLHDTFHCMGDHPEWG